MATTWQSPPSTPVVASDGRPAARRYAFVVAACSLVVVFAVAGTPIPLFNIYRAEDGVTNAALGMISVGYFVAAATALLVFGRLSSFIGRKPVALTSLGAAALSCVLLASADGPVLLFGGRVLQGLACGLASSALGAYVVDVAPARPAWVAALIAGSAPMIGVPLGAVSSGALVQFAPAPRQLIFEVTGALLLLLAVLLALSPETMPKASTSPQWF